MTYNVFSGTLNPTQYVSVGIKSRLEHNFIWVNLRSKDFIKANAIRSVILKVCKLIVVLLWRAEWVHAVKYWFVVTVCNLQQLDCIACFGMHVNEYCYLYCRLQIQPMCYISVKDLRFGQMIQVHLLNNLRSECEIWCAICPSLRRKHYAKRAVATGPWQMTNFKIRHRASTSTRWHFAFGAMLS